MRVKNAICVVAIVLLSLTGMKDAYSQNHSLFKSKNYDSTYAAFKKLADSNADSLAVVVKKALHTCKDTCSYNFVVFAMQAHLFQNSGEYDQAEIYYTKSLVLHPNQKNILLERAGLYYKTKQWERSIKDANKALLIDPNFSEAYYHKSLVFGYGLSNMDSALYAINKAIQIQPLDVEFLNFKVKILYEQKKCVDATDVQFALMEIEGITDENTIVLAELSICKGNPDEALKMLLLRNSKQESKIVTARIAYVYGLLGDYTSSVKYLERLTILDPTNPDVFYDLGGLKYKIGKKQEAINDLKYKTTKVKDKTTIYELLSDIYLAEEKSDSALFYINKALGPDMHAPDLLGKRASIYQVKNELPLAYKDYKALLKKDSCNYIALDFTSKYELLNKDFTSSVSSALKAIDCGFKYEFIEVLVQAYFYMGDFNKVNENINYWVKYYPKDAQALFIKAIMVAQDGDLDKSVALCKMALVHADVNDAAQQRNISILLALNYLAQKNYTNFHTEMDRLVIADRSFIEKSFITEKNTSSGNLYKIKCNHLSGFEFYLSVIIPETTLQEINKRYNVK